jgi:hypothetical protein
MKYRFRYEYGEFDEAIRRIKRGLFQWVLPAALAVCIPAAGWGSYVVARDPRNILGWAILMAGVFTATALLRLPRSIVLRAWRRHPELAGPRTVAVEDGGILFTAGKVEKRMPWSELKQVIETPALLILEQEDGFLHILPKRIFGGDARLADFRKLTAKSQSPQRESQSER